MHRKFGLLSPGKANSYSTALPRFCFPCVQCFPVSIPPADRLTLFTTDRYGILNVRTKIMVRACSIHERGWGTTKKSAQELTRRDRNTVSHPAQARGSNPGGNPGPSKILFKHGVHQSIALHDSSVVRTCTSSIGG